jgi:hypothetical protein
VSYYLPRSPLVEGELNAYTNAAQTLAVLSEIIGFQTTNAQLQASKPTVTVPAQ